MSYHSQAYMLRAYNPDCQPGLKGYIRVYTASVLLFKPEVIEVQVCIRISYRS